MSFNDEIKRKKQELDEYEQSLQRERQARYEAVAKAETERRNNFDRIKGIVDLIIDELMRTFFAEAFPNLRWTFIDKIPVTETYTSWLDGRQLRIKYVPLQGQHFLRAFTVPPSTSVFAIHLDDRGAESRYHVNLIKLAKHYRASSYSSGYDEGVITEYLKGDYIEREHLTSSELPKTEVTRESTEKALKKLFLEIYEHERRVKIYPSSNSKSFWK